jgi:predicted glutamine amidotransferase
MCIIIIKKKGLRVSNDILKSSARINPHGLGIVWLDDYKVSYHKSNEFNVLNTSRPFIAHFRYATVGAVNKENTHPFVCGSNKNELLMMNGTIKGLGN